MCKSTARNGEMEGNPTTTAEGDRRPESPASPTEAQASTNQAVVVRPRRSRSSWPWPWAVAAAGLALAATPFTWLWPGEEPIDPTNYALRAKRVLQTTPLIDGHNDLPWLLRVELHNRVRDDKFDPHQRLLGHTDISRMRQGIMGGQFWSVYVKCDASQEHFDDPSVREPSELALGGGACELLTHVASGS